MIPVKGILYNAFSGGTAQASNSDGRRMRCADFELNATECLEAYGLHKGTQLCQKYVEDMKECNRSSIMFARIFAMEVERAKKLAKGEIKFSERHGKPVPYDAYMSGTFYP